MDMSENRKLAGILKTEGYTNTEIASILGISRQRVWQYLKQKFKCKIHRQHFTKVDFGGRTISAICTCSKCGVFLGWYPPEVLPLDTPPKG